MYTYQGLWVSLLGSSSILCWLWLKPRNKRWHRYQYVQMFIVEIKNLSIWMFPLFFVAVEKTFGKRWEKVMTENLLFVSVSVKMVLKKSVQILCTLKRIRNVLIGAQTFCCWQGPFCQKRTHMWRLLTKHTMLKLALIGEIAGLSLDSLENKKWWSPALDWLEVCTNYTMLSMIE